MNFNIKGKNMELTDSIVGYVETKLQQVTKLVDAKDKAAHADIELGRTSKHHNKGDVYRTEINLRIKGKMLRSVSEKDDLYASIDEMKDMIMAEVKQYKEKRELGFRKGGQRLKEMVKGIFNS